MEPSCFTQALKQPEWKAAMSMEFNAFLSNGTWTLVPPRDHYNIIGNKWVFRLKRYPDGSIARYKARLVAKGFHQHPDVDYHDTFSPVVKTQTIKLVLCASLSKRWSLSHMDVNNAFLHGAINEDIYMSQLPGFVHSQFPRHVCKLQKALYGLKQAPRAWYHTLRAFLLRYGFTNAKSDTSLFVYHCGTTLAYFLVYVDDLLLTGNDSRFLTSLSLLLLDNFH
jgi:histone deacetylase 1/2